MSATRDPDQRKAVQRPSDYRTEAQPAHRPHRNFRTMAVTAAAAKLRAEGAKLVDSAPANLTSPRPATSRTRRSPPSKPLLAIHRRLRHIAEVRKAIIERHATDFGSSYTPDEAVFTTGGKLALFNAIECSSIMATRSFCLPVSLLGVL